MTQHHWTGWPGAICFHCGNEDPVEIGCADGTFDAWTGKWATEDLKKAAEESAKCPGGERLGKCPQCH